MMGLRGILITLNWIAWITLGAGVLSCNNLLAQESTRDIRLIIDISSSLKKTDPQQLRQTAVSSLIDQLPSSNTQAGIWTFGKYVNMLVPLKPVTAQWRILAKTRTRELSSVATATNIGEALKIASTGWQSRKPNSERHLILFTDGAIDISSNPAVNQQARAELVRTLLPALKQQQVRLHTIAFTATADHDLLEQLATQTGGSYQSVQRAEDLASALQLSLNKALAQPITTASNTTAKTNQTMPADLANKLVSDQLNEHQSLDHQLPAQHAEPTATKQSPPEAEQASQQTELKKSMANHESPDSISADALPTENIPKETLSKEAPQQKTRVEQIHEDIDSEENSFSGDANNDTNNTEAENEDLENPDTFDKDVDKSEETDEEPIVHATPVPKKTSFTESSSFKWIALSILACLNLLLFGFGLLWYRLYIQRQQAQQQPIEDDLAESADLSVQPVSKISIDAKKAQSEIKQPNIQPPAEPARSAVEITDSVLEQTDPLLTPESGSAKTIDEEDLLDDPLKDLHIDDFDHQLDLPDEETIDKPN